MVIRRRLIQITVTVVLFSIFLVFGLFQVAKVAHFHQLNLLHFKYVVELESKLPATLDGGALDVEGIHKSLVSIRAQPAACLDIINDFDRFVMRLIDTDIAIQLCVDALKIADDTLLALQRYSDSELPAETMHTILVNSAAVFTDHSVHFEAPITKTVKFITASMLIISSVLSLLMVAAIVYAGRSISKTVVMMNETASALEESELLNRKLAHFDSLTGLPNRNLLLNRLGHQISVARRKNSEFALLFIDLDRFKNVNDSMGHHAGDQLIREAGKRLVDCIRSSDTVARIGGDEFNVLLGEVSTAEDSAIVAEKIIKVLAEPFHLKGQNVYISGSVGISVYPNDADNTDDLQKYADLAMYQAKAKGKNSFEFYSSDLASQAGARLQMEQHLRLALERGEFMLHYQPVVKLQDMRTVGVEALLRWSQPELGMISPVDFIPVAEETGLIVDMGVWVLREACKTAKLWRDQCSPDFKIAVNVSPRQLRAEGFVASVKQALAAAQLPPSALDLEITESLMIEEDELSLGALQQLSELGVRLLLDDFGTGHSSLSYLHRLPFDVLKVDRSFVDKLHERRGSHDITSSIVAMAHALNLQVIAEGLESEADLAILQELQCEFAQGYLFSPPIPASEIDCNKIYCLERSKHNSAKS